MSSQQDESTTQAIKRSALNLIARRDHSRRELFDKLTKKHGQNTLIDMVLDQLTDRGFLNEAAFAESFVRSKTNKGQGPLKISAQLRARGIDQDTIVHYLKPDDNEFWVTQGQIALDKSGWRFKSKANPESMRLINGKKLRFLQQRGFSTEHIQTILNSSVSKFDED